MVYKGFFYRIERKGHVIKLKSKYAYIKLK